MSTFAIHAGDLHLRAAFHGPLDRPTAAEDNSETQRFLTPSLVAIDPAGALFGYPALMGVEARRPDTRTWRYRRNGLSSRDIVSTDSQGRGLTSESFAACAISKLGTEARVWSATTPDLALVVPSEIEPAARLRLAALAGETAGRPVTVIGEDDALMQILEPALDGDHLIVSVDDDAMRVRVVRRNGCAVSVMASEEVENLGLVALRASWLTRWNIEAATLVADAAAFADGDSFEFERMWQDIWDCLNADPRDKPKMPTWPLLRRSAVAALAVPRAALFAEIKERWHSAVAVAERILATTEIPAASLSRLVVVADKALAKLIAASVGDALGIAAPRRVLLGADAYARGGAALAAQGTIEQIKLSHTPYGLGVIGMAKDGAGTTVRALIEKGAPLPAEATFSLMANRDAQKRLLLSLETTGGDGAVGYRFEFGPMLGVGMLRVNLHVKWESNGRILVTAVDSESGNTQECIEAVETVAGRPLAGAAHLKALI